MSLLNEIQVKEVAWRWGGTTRVYEATSLVIDAEPEGEDFEVAIPEKRWTDEGVWLFFEVYSQHFRRISPSGAGGNDWIDLLNALKDPAVQVDFFPIWAVDDTIFYPVKPIRRRNRLLETNRTLFTPAVSILMEAATTEETYPIWARTTRQK